MASLNMVTENANVQRRRLVKIRERLLGKFKSNPTPTPGLIARLQAELQEFTHIRELHSTLCAELISRAGEITEEKKRSEFQEGVATDTDNIQAAYTELVEKIENIRSKNEGKSKTDNTTNPNQCTEHGAKLKDLEIPQFHGNIREFMHYKGIFESLVHNNSKYSQSEKMWFLMQSLKGEALKILSDTASNLSYPEAWAIVCEWYENKPMIINTLFNDLFGIKRIKDPSSIRNLVLETDAILRSLKSVGEDPDQWGSILHFHVASKLDEKTLNDWQNSNADCTEYPQYPELKKFLLGRAHAIEFSVFQPKQQSTLPTAKSFRESSKTKSESTLPKKFFSAAMNKTCICCKKFPHLLIECDEFKALSPSKRLDLIQESRLCVNCFNSKHMSQECLKPPCKICKSKHHSLLHLDNSKIAPKKAVEKDLVVSRGNEISVPSSSKNCAAMKGQNKFILLPTAVVQFSSNNSYGLARIMFDSASQPTAITDEFVKKYKIKTFRSSTLIEGVGGQLNTLFACKLTLKSRFSSFEIDIEADVVPSSAIKYKIPTDNSFISEEAVSSLQLAEKPLGYESIDMILGNEYYDRCVLTASATFDGVLFKNTHFGWTPTGPITKNVSCHSLSLISCASTREIQSDLRRFWETEEVNPIRAVEPEQTLCEQHFNETFSRSEDGRFIVRLPLKDSPEVLGESRNRALRALLYSEKRQSPELREQYVQFMNEYADLNHMTLVSNSTAPCTKIPSTENQNSTSDRAYYINHHAVLRPSSTTTKLRVVFNASASTVRGPSLNQILMIGPKLQPDLFDILIWFRLSLIAFAADITKMYRQVLVHPADRKLQRILWRSDVNETIREYELNTVTYGTKSASFLATKCLSVLAESIEAKLPETARVIKNCFYMDDLLCSAPSLEEALRLQESIHLTLVKAHFPLRKYVSNSTEFMSKINQSDDGPIAVELLPDNSTQILGLVWEPSPDVFRVKIDSSNLNINDVITKRIVLASSAKIFDPLGFVSPVTIRFKILLQSIWKENKEWDEPVSEENRRTFVDAIEDLNLLKMMTIRRPYSTLPVCKRQLIGFCDASFVAYCATVYMKTISHNNQEEIYLVCAKTKVAPLSKAKILNSDENFTIHRLELMAALLLSQLLQRLSSHLDLDLAEVQAYSDSQVTLCWLAKPPETWNQFVRNRVEKIQKIVPFSHWSYVRSAENPSDLATRGISASNLISSKLWLNGPGFLSGEQSQDFLSENEKSSSSNCNVIANCMLATSVASTNSVTISEPSLFVSSSSFIRLQFAVARILRLKNRRELSSVQLTATPNAEELNNSFLALVKYAQRLAFANEVQQLENGKPINRRSRLWFLQPMIDENGVMRVSGRLEHANISFEKRHPIIINARNPFMQLYAKFIHENYFHAGAKFIVTFLHSRFRFVGGIHSLAKGIVRKCVICARYNHRPQKQLMAQLPPERVRISPPFTTVVIDFAGHFDTKCVGHRSTIFFKSYLCVIVCCSTRAVHFEVMSNLETEQFIHAFDRFKARRGPPIKIFSDNGSTFVKASKILRIDWDFGPPYGPHHQGLAEAGVKSAKRSLAKVTKNCVLTFEEYTTLFSKIESVLNSRPICRHGDGYLTPGHFLTGKHLLVPPEPESGSITLHQRFYLVDKIFRDFWTSWSRSYLNDLNNRTKWLKKFPNLRTGNIVLVVQPNTKPADWPLAVIVKIHQSTDRLVRTVTIRTGGKEYERPVTKIILLPLEDSNPESSRGSVSSIIA